MRPSVEIVCFAFPQTIYAKTCEEDGSPSENPFFFRCDLRTKKWEKLAIDTQDLVHVSPILNPEDGEEDGIVVIRSEKNAYDVHDSPLVRIKIERHMFRATDSLLHHGFMAVRKLREGVEVEKTLSEAIVAYKRRERVKGQRSSKSLQQKFFPSAYEGVELIPIFGDNNDLFWYSFSPSGLIYAQGVGNDCEFLFRCDVEQKKWERVPVEARDINDVAFVVNPADGREDGN
ncbi:hypothetical protein M3Y99_00433300 [Aphelenchoides fujianensis]|nr:hypothetical protein M3Y99_00433300 [Aphelenchoides fujianensis]